MVSLKSCVKIKDSDYGHLAEKPLDSNSDTAGRGCSVVLPDARHGEARRTVVVTTVDGIRHVDGGYNSAGAAASALAAFVVTLNAFNAGPTSVSSISMIDQGDHVTVRTFTVVNGVVTVV